MDPLGWGQGKLNGAMFLVLLYKFFDKERKDELLHGERVLLMMKGMVYQSTSIIVDNKSYEQGLNLSGS